MVQWLNMRNRRDWMCQGGILNWMARRSYSIIRLWQSFFFLLPQYSDKVAVCCVQSSFGGVSLWVSNLRLGGISTPPLCWSWKAEHLHTGPMVKAQRSSAKHESRGFYFLSFIYLFVYMGAFFFFFLESGISLTTLHLLYRLVLTPSINILIVY